MSACTRHRVRLGAAPAIIGIDVGEDYLDLARLSADRGSLSHHRVALARIRRPVADSVADLIGGAVGKALHGAVALVDSPRTPRDVDCSDARLVMREDAPRARSIDAALRELLRVKLNGTMRPLSMFPTPLAAYFAGCAADHRCKPHLRAIAEEMFAAIIEIPRPAPHARLVGGTFTRFMLAGFAVFPALDKLGVRAFEAYPDLQMRLWSAGVQLPPKGSRREALAVRIGICARLAKIVGVKAYQAPRTLDEADAAVLALSAAASLDADSLLELRCPPEGRFAVAFPPA